VHEAGHDPTGSLLDELEGAPVSARDVARARRAPRGRSLGRTEVHPQRGEQQRRVFAPALASAWWK